MFKKRIIIISIPIIFFICIIANITHTKETNINDTFPIAFFEEDENGIKTKLTVVPKGVNYDISVDCNKGAIGFWNYTTKGPVIKNMTETLTKCNITFTNASRRLKELGIHESVVTEGTGIYEINHNDAKISSNQNDTVYSNLKRTEYRYAGNNPNNYVTFNNEVWRIIGLVNTIEGKRLKITKEEPIGLNSWDTSDASINNGFGVNEYSQSDVMKLMNPGHESETVGGSLYYNRQKGNCYDGENNKNSACDFTQNGLNEPAKNQIDSVTWHTGTNGTTTYSSMNVIHYYALERSNNHGKSCNGGIYCNDTVIRTTLWKGKIGLISPSDYGYATSGGSITNREICLNKEMSTWNKSEISDCKNNSWIYKPEESQFLMNSLATGNHSELIFNIGNPGYVDNYYAYYAFLVRPTLYLKENIKIISGTGTKTNSYLLSE